MSRFSPQRVYDRSPVVAQHIMATLSGYQRNHLRYGKAYWKHRKWLQHFDSWSLDHKLEYQWKTLNKFLKYVSSSSNFYRELYRNVELENIKSLDTLQTLPSVDKEDIRNNISSIYTVPAAGSVEGHTGGTTGKSLVVRFTREDEMIRMAFLDHFKSKLGFEHREMRRATFMGKPIVASQRKSAPFWRYNHACKQMLYSSFHLSEENKLAYVKSLNSFKPQAIDGFFTCMLDIASYIQRNGLEVEFRPVAIFPTSETITESGRALLESVFGAPVYNQYASSEGAPFITECKNHRLHVEHASGIFDTINGSSGEVAVTSFFSHGTPLIRYKIGDSVRFDNVHDCDCGNQTLMVQTIEGRSEDFLVRSDGSRINNAVIANLFKNIPNAVIHAQVIQYSLELIEILLEVDIAHYHAGYDETLRDEFYRVFTRETRLNILHVDTIPREKSGKHRLVKNLMNK